MSLLMIMRVVFHVKISNFKINGNALLFNVADESQWFMYTCNPRLIYTEICAAIVIGLQTVKSCDTRSCAYS